MTTQRSESELTALRKTAIDLAASRKERPTTVHLLAAIAARKSTAGDLLVERGLDKEALLKAGRSFDEETSDAIARSLAQAREVAKRSRGPVSTDGVERRQPSISPDSKLTLLEPTSLHLLVALLADRRLAAFRALTLSGVDAVRLRTSALTLALGIVTPRREVARAQAPSAAMRPTAGPHRPARPTSSGPTGDEARRSTGTKAGATLVPLLPAMRTPTTSARVVPPHRLRHPRRPARASEVVPSRARVDAPEIPPAPALPRDLCRAEGEREDLGVAPLLSSIASAVRPEAHAGIVCREDEVERVLDVLAKFRANAPCLVGAAGVGKTSVALALAKPLAARNETLMEVQSTALVAGTAARGALAERISTLFDEARRSPTKIVLFVDDVHELLAGGDEAVAELKVQLARGDVRFVTATNTESLRRAVESDPQLSRRLVPIEIEEPDEEEAFMMVRSAARVLEPHHGVRYSDEALAAAISWSVRYLPSRALPDKAIGALDYAGARVSRAGAKTTTRGGVRIAPTVELTHLASAMSELAGVPPERLLETDRDRMLGLEVFLGERVVGHRENLTRIARQLRKSAAGLRQRRPLGSFLLLGPTGVGKTETAKALAEALFGAEEAMTRIDFSEYSESHALARLIGAPPGYVGHDAGGQLTEAVRKRPYQVLLLDEIEKAHTDVLLSFLQVLDEGHLTDGRGRRVDFTNVVVICTSNLGSRDVATAVRGRSVGFAQGPTTSTKDLSGLATAAAKKHLPIELYNRFDEILFFAPLSRVEVSKVAEHQLDDLRAVLAERDVRLEIEDGVIDRLLDAGGYDPELGARPMRRTLARLVEGPIAELLLRGELTAGTVALVGVEDGEIVVDSVRARATA